MAEGINFTEEWLQSKNELDGVKLDGKKHELRYQITKKARY